MNISKITLGTVQIGMNYGIANVDGKPEFNSAINLLKYAWNNGINTFDTSPSYGNCEEVIGSFINSEIKEKENLIIVSKVPKIEDLEKISYENLLTIIKKHVNDSLKALHIEKFPFYLIHDSQALFLNNGIIVQCLEEIKKEGLIENIGISIYTPEEVEISLTFKEINSIQVPINIFDHRLINTGLLKSLKKQNYTIFARSIYLQGLFFLSPKNLPKNLEIAREPLIKLQKISKDYSIDITKLALLFIRDLPEINSVVIGAEKIEQIKQNLEISSETPLEDEIYNRITEEFSELSENIINPSLWNK